MKNICLIFANENSKNWRIGFFQEPISAVRGDPRVSSLSCSLALSFFDIYINIYMYTNSTCCKVFCPFQPFKIKILQNPSLVHTHIRIPRWCKSFKSLSFVVFALRWLWVIQDSFFYILPMFNLQLLFRDVFCISKI